MHVHMSAIMDGWHGSRIAVSRHDSEFQRQEAACLRARSHWADHEMTGAKARVVGACPSVLNPTAHPTEWDGPARRVSNRTVKPSIWCCPFEVEVRNHAPEKRVRSLGQWCWTGGDYGDSRLERQGTRPVWVPVTFI